MNKTKKLRPTNKKVRKNANYKTKHMKTKHLVTKHLETNHEKSYIKIFSKVWIVKQSDITYPEFQQNYELNKFTREYNSEGVSLTFGAGGRRSYSAFIGFLRGLHNMKIGKSNAFCSSHFLSTVSGSSWLLGTFVFANKNIHKDVLLGESILPKNISLTTLKNTNFNMDYNSNKYLGARLIKADIQKLIIQGKKENILPSYLWSYACGKLFLQPYGLDKKVMTLNSYDSKNIQEITGQVTISPNDNAPLLISNCSLLNLTNKSKPKGTTLFQITPYYAGIPNIIYNKETPFAYEHTEKESYIGGHFQSTFSLGSIRPYLGTDGIQNFNLFDANDESKNNINLYNLKIEKESCQLFTLDQLIGISGSSQVSKFTHLADDITPQYNMWCPYQNNSNVMVPIGDGAYCDVPGIITLLSRNVKHIITFITCGSDLKEGITPDSHADFCLLNILNLFGLYNEEECINVKPDFDQSNDIQVFRQYDWTFFAQNLLNTKATGGPVYSKQKMLVLPNLLCNIVGGYELDLLVIVVQSSSIFNNLLPKSITEQFTDKNSQFYNFPNITMTTDDPQTLMSITEETSNLLSSYCDWCINYPPLKATIEEMYKEAKTP